MDKVVILMAKALDEANNGVEYDIKDGALCPFCGQRIRVTHTMSWLGMSRKRYHKCLNINCPLHVTDTTIISWQEH